MQGATASASGAVEKYRLEFIEAKGRYFTFGEADHKRGSDLGRASRTAVMFHLTMGTDDAAFIAARPHLVSVKPYVANDALGGRLRVGRAVFNLFVDCARSTPSRPGACCTGLWSADGVGHPLTLVGFNDIHHAVAAGSALRDVWAETTMLYTRLLAGHVEAGGDADARPVGAGSIHILPFDFARQLTTLRVRGPARDAGCGPSRPSAGCWASSGRFSSPDCRGAPATEES